jgi:hypothetical protein
MLKRYRNMLGSWETFSILLPQITAVHSTQYKEAELLNSLPYKRIISNEN